MSRTPRPLALLLCGLASCAHHGGLEPQPPGWSQLEWQTCPAELPAAAEASCALVQVPLDHNMPDGRHIEIFLRRFVPAGPIRGQLWALDGGPGDAGDGFVQPEFREPVLAAGFELLIPSHRGTAYGTSLTCPKAEDTESCIAELQANWDEGLRQFDTHSAALDVAALVAGHPDAGKQTTLVFGGSYGSVWGQRLLKTSPQLFDGAYFDALGDLGMSFEQVGTWMQRVGHGLLARCGAEPNCDRRFEGGIEAALVRVQQAMTTEQGCVAIFGRDPLQSLFMRWLDSADETRALIAPLLLRVDRCSTTDQAEIARALGDQPIKPPSPSSPHQHNPLLNLVTIYRELYRVELPSPKLAEIEAGLVFDDGAMMHHHERRALFPADFGRERDLEPGTFTGPLHLVHGELDPRSPANILDLVARRWPGAQHDRISLPDGGHASPRFTLRHDGQRCSTRWLQSFLEDPRRPFDKSCLDAVPRLDATLTNENALATVLSRFTWPSAWGSASPGPASSPPERPKVVGGDDAVR